jgi:hypothetical protein
MKKIVTYGTMKYTTTAITAVSKTAVVTLKKVVLLFYRRWFLHLASASAIVLYPL